MHYCDCHTFYFFAGMVTATFGILMLSVIVGHTRTFIKGLQCSASRVSGRGSQPNT